MNAVLRNLLQETNQYLPRIPFPHAAAGESPCLPRHACGGNFIPNVTDGSVTYAPCAHNTVRRGFSFED